MIIGGGFGGSVNFCQLAQKWVRKSFCCNAANATRWVRFRLRRSKWPTSFGMLKAKELTAPGISAKIERGLFDERPLTKKDALYTLVWAKVKQRCRVPGLSYKTNYPVLALNQYENTSKSNKAALALFSNLNRGLFK